jgi:hypothetical protein
MHQNLVRNNAKYEYVHCIYKRIIIKPVWVAMLMPTSVNKLPSIYARVSSIMTE